MLVHAGIDPMSDAAKEIEGTIDDTFHAGAYATGGIDKFGDGTRSGIDLNQMSHNVSVPSFRDVQAAAKRDAFYQRLGMGKLPDTMDKFMQYWKAAVLLRPGFAFRVALSDEAFGSVLRNGLGSYLLARTAAKKAFMDASEESYWKTFDSMTEAGKDTSDILPYNSLYHGRIEGKIGSALAAITNRVPPELLAKVRTANDVASLVYSHAAHALYKAGGGALTLPQYLDGAKSFYDHQWTGDSALFDNIASVAHGGASGDPDQFAKVAIGGGAAVDLKRSGVYRETMQSDPLFMQKWWFQLNQKAQGPFSRVVLDHMGEDKAAQAQHVFDAMKSGTYDEEMKKSPRWSTVPDEVDRTVGVNATRDEALHNWASKVVEGVHQALKEDGNVTAEDATSGPMKDVISHMQTHGVAPDMSTLEKVHPNDRPMGAFGPELIAVPKVDQLVSKGFHLLSRQIDWLSREPITLHAYTEELAKARVVALAKTGGNAELAEPLASDMAAKAAMGRVKPFIHSPEIRSQFEILHRTAMPFLFAQDQFIKRWGRTFVDSPDGIRKAQLMMQGLQSSGFIHKDAQGNDVFYYPGSQYATSLVAGTLSKFHIGANLPISVPFTGEVSGLMPGLNNPTTPSVGPTVAIPLKALAGWFPELQPAQQALLQGGASTGYLDQIMPSTVSRLLTAVQGSPNSSGEFSASMVKAMQLLAVNGHGLPENATTEQKQQYINRVTSWTRSLFLTKAMLGFVAPATPTAGFRHEEPGLAPSAVDERTSL